LWLCDECAKWTRPGFFRLKEDQETLTVEPPEGNFRHILISMTEDWGDAPDEDQHVIMCFSPEQAEELARKLKDAAKVAREHIAEQTEARRAASEGAKCGEATMTNSGYYRFSASRPIQSNVQQCSHLFKD